MATLLRGLVGGPLLALLACQPSETTGTTELRPRLDQIDQRLIAIEAQLQTVTEWTAARTAEQRARAAERAATLAEIEARRAEAKAQREASRAERTRGLFGGSESGSGDPLAGLERTDSDGLEGASEGIQCASPSTGRIECTIDRAFLDGLLADPAKLMRQARVVPRVVDAKTRGFKLYGIRRDSIPKRLGLKNGDAIVEVDGTELTDIDAAMEAYAKLRDTDRTVIELERKGMPLALTIDIID